MALSGSVSTSSYEGRYLTLSWTATQNTSTNQSTISWTLSANGGSSSYYYTGPVTLTIDGKTAYYLSSSDRYAMYKGTIATGKTAITHYSDGSRSFLVEIDAAIYSTSVNCTASERFTLDDIPRKATVSQYLSAVNENAITIRWSSDVTIDKVWYSINNGSTFNEIWTGSDTSGSYSITGLSPDTTYRVKTRVRRKDSQLTTDSSALSIATYPYPYSNAPTFDIGNACNLTLTNPLSREVTVNVTAWGSTILETTTSGTSVTIPSSVADTLYQTIPNASSGTYTVTVAYGSQTRTTNGTYKAPSSSAPTIGSATYIDGNTSVTNITGNNQKIIPGKSKLTFTVSGSAKNYASLSSAKVTYSGVDYPMTLSGSSASVSNINALAVDSAVITLTDSRGLSTTQTVSIDIVEYTVPTLSATAQRVSGFYSSTEITPTTNYTYIGSNAVTIQLQARKTSESSYSVTQTISSSGTSTVSLDNQYPWYILLTITDSFGGSSTYEITIGKGIPLFYFDIVKSSVAMDMFPTHSNAFEVNGDIYINGEVIGDFVIEEGTDGIWTYRKWNSGIAECWGWHATTVTASDWSAWGNLYEAGGSSRTEAFPSGLFNAVPIVMVSPPQASNGAFVETTGQGSATSTPNIFLVRPSKISSTVNFNVPIYARGTWE